MKVEERLGKALGRASWLAFRPWVWDETDSERPGIGQSVVFVVLNYLVAYVFGMFVLGLVTIDDPIAGRFWGRPFNGMALTTFQIASLVSICFACFVVIAVVALSVCAGWSWLVYRLLGSHATPGVHFSLVLHLVFLEFIAATSVINVPGVVGNRPDFWFNEWSFNVAVLAFVATRAWYCVVAWYEMKSLHAPSQPRYRLSFVAAFFPAYVIVQAAAWWYYLRVAERVVLTYR